MVRLVYQLVSLICWFGYVGKFRIWKFRDVAWNLTLPGVGCIQFIAHRERKGLLT